MKHTYMQMCFNVEHTEAVTKWPPFWDFISKRIFLNENVQNFVQTSLIFIIQ